MKSSRNWVIRLLVLVMTVFVLAPADAAETGASRAAGVQTITILHTNDIHSRVEESKDGIGYAKLAALVKRYKTANPNTLVLDAGDSFHGQTIANLVRGESVVSIMNAIGFDAMTAGNHDFNYGTARLLELSEQAKFPVLGANVKKTDGSRLLKSYVIKEAAGVKIGIFGLSTPETAYKTHPNNVAGITFTDPVAEAKTMVEELKGKADIIVALVHLGVDESSADTSVKVAEQVPGIDLIIDGHSHTLLENGRMVGSVLIAQTGEYLKNIGRVELTIESGKLTGKKAEILTKAAVEADKVPAEQAVLDIVNGIKKVQDQVLQQPVGNTSVKLEGEREVVRKGESNLGNLIADAMLSESGADVGITNGGGIRASIEAGIITKGQVITVLPFGNYIQTKKVKGSDIQAALELGVSAYPESLGGFPQVGGMTFEFDPAQPKGNRVTAVFVQGKQLDPQQSYVLATNDFMAAGGDQYTMLKDYPIANDFSSLEEALIAYIQKKGVVEPKVEGRIQVKAPTPAQPAPAAIDVPEQAASASVYIVKKGDTLSKIAKLYQTTWQALQKQNGLQNPHRIYPGQKIIVPAAAQ